MSVASVALSPVYEEYWNFPGHLAGNSGPWSDDSILVFLSIGGSVIPMRVLETDSIASVKLRIQNYKGFFVKRQKLVFSGKELSRNNSRVRDYGVADGNVLHLVVRLSYLQAITVRTVCGREFNFHVERKRNIGYVKEQIARRGKGILDLRDQELICDGKELEDQRLIGDLCKSNDAVLHLLTRKSAKVRAKPVEKDFEVSIVSSEEKKKDSNAIAHGEPCREQDIAVVPVRKKFVLEPIVVNPKLVLSAVMRKMIDATIDGLERGNQPVRSCEGSGGAYFMQDSSGQGYVSVFKPVDEEPMAVNNPRGLPLSLDGEGLKKGTRVGEGAFREVAAYILDHPSNGPRSLSSDEKGFAGVPPTIMIKCRDSGFHHSSLSHGAPRNNIKIGSLQMFVKNCGSCEDMGPTTFPVDEVHKISVLDIRLANADRHAGNILIHKDTEEDQTVLIPIDHGYCLPENFIDCTFDWLYWPQARKPYSPDTIAYINSLDAEKDIQLLKIHGWSLPPECARVFRISAMLLKKGAARGLTPFAIGSIMCRETLKKESVIEQIVREAEDASLPGTDEDASLRGTDEDASLRGTDEDAFLECLSLIMDHHLDELSN